MPGRQQIPSFQMARGSTNERDTQTEVGSIFYNTDTSNVEVYHEDLSNNVGWRDLVMNNRVGMDLSGVDNITFSDGTSQRTARPPFAFINYQDYTKEYTVFAGNPQETNPNNLNGEITDMAVPVVIPNDDTNVMLTCRLLGEWNATNYDKGLVIKKVRQPLGGGSPIISILRPPVAGTWNGRVLSTCMIPIDVADYNHTMESATIIYMDTVNAGTITYTPLLVNTHGNGSSKFYLNRVINLANSHQYERGSSTLIVQAMN